MQEHIRERVLKGASYMIENKCTMEEVSKELGISESTVHCDLRERLKEVNPGLKRITDGIIDSNVVKGKVRGGLTMAKRRREKLREKEDSNQSVSSSREVGCKDKAREIIANMKFEDKVKLVRLASEKGLRLEDEILPAMIGVAEMMNKSLFMENLRFIQELEGGANNDLC